MHAIHPNARTTPAVRAEIARSVETTGVLARRFGVSTETIRKWRKRGPADCQDRSARPHKLRGRRARKSEPSSVPCGEPPAFRSTTSPSWSPTSCRT
jgi:transposase-like protein